MARCILGDIALAELVDVNGASNLQASAANPLGRAHRSRAEEGRRIQDFSDDVLLLNSKNDIP